MGVVNRGYEQSRFTEGPGGFARMRRSQNNLAGKHSVLRELGVGTNDPDTALHVLSESAGGSVTVERLQDTANPASIYLKKSRGNLVAQTVISDDDNIGDLVVQGYVGANNGYQSMAHFQFEVDGSVTDAAYGAPSRMMLKLASGSALVERMRVESDGDVGIGNFSSVAAAGKLDVQGIIAISTEVSTPSQQAGIGKVYTKSDGKLYFISGDVSETDLTASGGSGEANENSFKTISVSGQSDVVADADDDTLTLAAGSNVTITTNAGTDTITVAATDTNTQLTTEAVQDIVGAMFSGNTETRVSVTYQDGDGTIDVAVDDMTADTQLTSEQVQDIVGAMFSSNTETRCTVTYQDADGTIDVVVDDLDTNLTTEEVQDIVGAMFSSNTETRITATYEDGDGTIDLVVDDMTADTQLTTEAVQDIVGAMFSSNTETRCTVTYEDGDGTIDVVVDDMTANTQLTQEQVEDYAGALVASGGTKTGIAVTYQDGTGDMDFVVSDLTVASDSGSTAMTPGDTLTIAGGTNISTAMSGDTLTINQSGGGEANESSFKTISVSGQDDVVADADDDTLTLAAGSNVTITTTAGTDTITFASADTNTQLSTEAVQDIVGAMFTSNTETRITATYEDGDGTIDLVVTDMTADTQLTQEQVEDFAGALVASGGTKTGISVTYQDGTGDMDFVVSDLTVASDGGSTAMTPGDTLTIAGGTNCTTATSGDTLTINATDTNTQLSTEAVQDIVGAMFSSNTETRCTVTYQDGDGTIDVVVDDMTADTQLTTEAVQDIVGAMFSSNTETRCTVTYQDGDGTIDVVVDDMSGGGGSGDVEAGSTFTTQGVIMACTGADKTIDDPDATLTTNDQAMVVSSPVQTSFAVDCGSRDGNGIWTFTTGTGDSGSAQNNQGMVKIIAQTSANASLFLGDTASDTKGGLKYKNNGDSMQLIANGNAVLELDSSKVVEFKIAAASKSGQGTATSDFMSQVEITPNRWLEVKIDGVQYFLPAFAASQFS